MLFQDNQNLELNMSIAPQINRGVAVVELASVLVFAFFSKLALDQVFWKYSGPVSLIIMLVLLFFYMKARDKSWAELGLIKLPGWKSVLLVLPQALLGVVAIIATGAGVQLGGDALGFWEAGGNEAGIEARFEGLEGSLPQLALWLFFGWVAAGFGEEIFFRGFLISRARAIVDGLPLAAFLSVFLPALLFGMAHFYYQGLPGLVTTGAIGLTIGTLYLLYKRNLWPLIIAHGLVDTLGFTTMYLGLDV
jgi:membrane protease YdiL (CAAX protease family)